MVIKINHNIFSMLVQRNLSRVSNRLEQSFERLSSGTRINRSADDPAGLANSERIRYEIQGLRQNQQNVNRAFSLIGTAESYLDTIVSTLQRVRELVVQGANDTLNPANRQSIQTEITQSLEEIERIATTSKFNDHYLFNGSLQNLSIRVGTDSLQTVVLSINDHRTSALGARSEITTDLPVGVTPLTAGLVQINDIAVPDSVSDGRSTISTAASALAKANAINRIESQTGVHAEPQATIHTGVASVQAVTLDGVNRQLLINGISIQPVVIDSGDSSGTLVQAINSRSDQTGVTTSVDPAGVLELTAADGRNIEISTGGIVGNVADELGLSTIDEDVALTATGKITLTAIRSFILNDATGVLGMTTPVHQVNSVAATAIQFVSVINVDQASQSLRSIDTAISQISQSRSALGAIYNRMEGVVDTLSQRIEDLSSTDSRIRDTDFAFETARLMQSQILQEAGIAMLSQANVTPRRALELIRNL